MNTRIDVNDFLKVKWTSLVDFNYFEVFYYHKMLVINLNDFGNPFSYEYFLCKYSKVNIIVNFDYFEIGFKILWKSQKSNIYERVNKKYNIVWNCEVVKVKV